MPLKVWPNTALGCNHILHAPVTAFVSSCWYPMYYPEGMKVRVGPMQWSKPNSILVRIRTRAAGFKIVSGDHYTTTAHNAALRSSLNYGLSVLYVDCMACKRQKFGDATTVWPWRGITSHQYLWNSVRIGDWTITRWQLGSRPVGSRLGFFNKGFLQWSVPSWKL